MPTWVVFTNSVLDKLNLSIPGKALAVSNNQAVPMHRLKRAVPVFVMRLLLRR